MMNLLLLCDDIHTIFSTLIVCCLLKKQKKCNFYHNTSNINNQHNWYKIVFLRGKSTNPPLLIGFHTVHV